ncbi:hypothetical protein X471_01090 [Bartonella bacilliformis str. Heidi Mejia]|nr:hypothetical protein X471_01090 [Bartonella bacilliformis str. Heidi Mejia]KEG17466.1 hypothetical protein H707_01102 [Bartonella bacilliformis Hosp800-02]KEG21596.1 hypothetical protein H703_01111 [Bartonella bacilliformis Ver075]KEG21851.1 hypothetical protein H708_01105 [Bartonella bacilliformis VAB9028]KEG23226.1 hypothetical protein H706_01115 [Bartonella bacilliformis CAR600-02]
MVFLPRWFGWLLIESSAHGDFKYRSAQGLDPEFIAKLEQKFGFDKPPLERYLTMLGNYLRFDFGESYTQGTFGYCTY